VSHHVYVVRQLRERPLELLHAIAGPDATFRAGQREAIDAVVTDRRRVLLVQRTGWGKSAVYFIATRLPETTALRRPSSSRRSSR
jgi:ATP-dependent DNA helicase RecQ